MSDFDLSDFNKKVIDEFRAHSGVCGGVFAGMPMILVTHTGAKSGVERTTPLVYSRDGDRLVIIASKGGAPTNPAWLHNLKANPNTVVEVGDERFDAVATVLEDGEERRRLFDQQAAAMANFKDYEAATTRVIPVVVLTRAS